MLGKGWLGRTIKHSCCLLNCCYEHKLFYVKLVTKLKLKKQ